MSAALIKSKLAGIAGRGDMHGTVRLRTRFLAALLIATGLLAEPVRAADVALHQHPDVIAATVQVQDADTFTVSSPYDTPQRYADGFRVAGKRGEVYGGRKLRHDHATKQPSSRDLHDVRIPRAVRHVMV